MANTARRLQEKRRQGILLCFFACLALPLFVAFGPDAQAARSVVHLCDPGDWLIARHGRDSLLEASDAAPGSMLVVTGGALSSAGAPPGREAAFAVAMLEAAGVDVVNLAHRDLTGDAVEFREALAGCESGFISASFTMPDQTWDPYVAVERDGWKVVFIGVAGRSPSMDLPGRGTIPGITYVSPPEALARTLARAPEADAVVLLADLPLAEAVALRQEFPRLEAVLCSGRGGVQLAEAACGGVHLSPAGGNRAAVYGEGRVAGRVVVLPAPEQEHLDYAGTGGQFDFLLSPAQEGPVVAFEPIGPPSQLAAGRTHSLGLEVESRAVRMTVHSVSSLDSLGPALAPEGRRWLVFDVEWENLLAPQWVRERELPVAYNIPVLGNHLYLIKDGWRVAPMREIDGIPRLLGKETEILLPDKGNKQRGTLAYEIPADAEPETLEFRFYDFAHGHMTAHVLDAIDPRADRKPEEPAFPPAVNEIVEAAVYGTDFADELDGRTAPPGMAFISVDLRARSMLTFQTDATAFVPGAERGEKIEIGTVSDWLEATKYTHLVVDGEYAYAPEPDLSTLPEDPRFLPDTMTGGRVVFLAPGNFESLELRGDFPNARLPGGELMRPQPVRFRLHGEPPEPTGRDVLWSVVDDTVEVAVTAQSAAESFAGIQAIDGKRFMVLDVTVSNAGDKPEFFQTSEQLQYVDARGRQSRPHRATFEGIYRPVENVWVPNGEKRSFQLAYLIDHNETQLRLSYRGFSLAEIVELAELEESVPVEETDPVVEEPGPLPVEAAEQPAEAPDEVEVAMPEDDEPLLVLDPVGGGEPEEEQPEEDMQLTGLARMRIVGEDEMESWVRRQNRDGVNLALRPLGARVSTHTDESDYRLLEVHNGRLDVSGRRLYIGGYQIELAGMHRAGINRLAMVLSRWEEDLKLTIGVPDGEDGHMTIAAIEDERMVETHMRVLEFDPVETQEIRLTVEDIGSEESSRMHTRLIEFMAFEGPLDDKSESVLSRGGSNISRIDYGGSVFHTTEDTRRNVAHLLTAPDGRDYFRWRRDEKSWTSPVILAFQANRTALVDSIELWPADHEERRRHLPHLMKISASEEEPFQGYTAVGEYEIMTGELPWRIEFPEPVAARFLRLEFKHREEFDEISIGELVVLEGSAPGYESVLIRGDGVGWRHREQPTLDSLMGEDAAKVRKIEADFFPENAAKLDQNEWAGSRLDGPELQHSYRITVDYQSRTEVPELQLHMAPFVRGRVRVLDGEGKLVEIPEPERRGGTSLIYQLSVDPGDYLVEVTSAPVYLFMGFDTSGSMGRALPITRSSLPGLLKDLPEGVYIALASSLKDPETGKHFTLFSPYSRDAEALEQANGAMFDARRGGSDWYNFLRDMLEWADDNLPSGGIGAKVLVADGVGSGNYFTMWDRLHMTSQRLYTVGWGSQTLRLDHMDSNTGWTAARGLFNAAWFCNGRYFEPQADHELVESYEEVLRDVQSPVDYALRFHVRRRQPGQFITKAPAGENLPILFVLDASGSMLIELEDRTRLDVAFDVIEQVVNTLPDDAEVGLRVYGHRYRSFGDERARAAVDSELLIPVGPLDREAFIRTVRSINARGATPLAHTIEQIPRDLRGLDRPRVIVLTDGVESFRRDPVAKSRALRQQHPDMEYIVIGFMIDQMVDRENLRGMADGGEGVYYNATDGPSLVRSLEQAISPVIRYALYDREGQEVFAGKFGDSHELPEGTYALRAMIDDGVAEIPIRVRKGRATLITVEDLPAPEHYDDRGEKEVEDVEPTEPAAPPRFCTQCGGRIGQDARFCTGCGAAVQ